MMIFSISRYLSMLICFVGVAIGQELGNFSTEWKDGILNRLDANDFKSAKTAVQNLSKTAKNQHGNEKAKTLKLIRCIKELYDARKDYHAAKKYERAVNRKIAEYKRQAENLARPSSISPSARQQKMLQLKQKASDICDMAESKKEIAVNNLNKALQNGDELALDIYMQTPQDAVILAGIVKDMAYESKKDVEYKIRFEQERKTLDLKRENMLAEAKRRDEERATKIKHQEIAAMAQDENSRFLIEQLTKMAMAGEAEAQVALARLYHVGGVVKLNLSSAYDWYKKAAELGHFEAQHIIGGFYYSGEVVAKDYKTAVYWWKKSAAQDYAPAQYELSCCYNKGEGVEKNEKLALELLSKAAEQNNVHALTELGSMYFEGIGVSKDINKAVTLFKKAYELGDIDGSASYLLASCYELGNGVEQDSTKAYELYQESARKGFDLAKKIIVTIDSTIPNVLIPLMEKADQGDSDAQYELASQYYLGKVVLKNKNKAVELLTDTASRGHVKSQAALGIIYINEESFSLAANWLRKAADKGDANSQYYLGVMYMSGTGVYPNMQQGVSLLQKAANQGHVEAIDALNKLKRTGVKFY